MNIFMCHALSELEIISLETKQNYWARNTFKFSNIYYCHNSYWKSCTNLLCKETECTYVPIFPYPHLHNNIFIFTNLLGKKHVSSNYILIFTISVMKSFHTFISQLFFTFLNVHIPQHLHIGVLIYFKYFRLSHLTFMTNRIDICSWILIILVQSCFLSFNFYIIKCITIEKIIHLIK